MGQDIHIRIVKYNSDKNFYEELTLYKPGEEYHYNEEGNKIVDNPYFQKVHIDAGRNYEMFEGMKDGDENDGYGHFPWTKVKLNALDPKIKEDIEEKMDTPGYFDFYELTFADMKLYLNEHPTVVDYDNNNFNWEEDDGERPRKINPIKPLFDEIVNYAQLADGWDWGLEPFGYYKIIFYFDC